MNELSVTPGTDKKVFDLIDVVEEEDVMDRTGPLRGRTVYELVDAVIDEKPAPTVAAVSEEEIMKRVTAIAENMSRELFPAIAERIIREEIAKLKNDRAPEEKN